MSWLTRITCILMHVACFQGNYFLLLFRAGNLVRKFKILITSKILNLSILISVKAWESIIVIPLQCSRFFEILNPKS